MSQYYDDAAGILRSIILSAIAPHRLATAPPQLPSFPRDNGEKEGSYLDLPSHEEDSAFHLYADSEDGLKERCPISVLVFRSPGIIKLNLRRAQEKDFPSNILPACKTPFLPCSPAYRMPAPLSHINVQPGVCTSVPSAIERILFS